MQQNRAVKPYKMATQVFSPQLLALIAARLCEKKHKLPSEPLTLAVLVR
jgi:hypothetical protein